MVTFETEGAQGAFEIVQAKTLFPNPSPVIDVVGNKLHDQLDVVLQLVLVAPVQLFEVNTVIVGVPLTLVAVQPFASVTDVRVYPVVEMGVAGMLAPLV